MQQQVKELNEKVDLVVEAQKKSILSVFNPAIGLVTEIIPSYTSQGSDKTGSDRPGGFDFFVRSVELNLAASVDPFARAYAVFNASVDPVTGEATATVEEAAIQTTSLPWNLTLKGGRFFAEFGRLSYVHDHELPFVYRPLVLDEYIGGESKTDGHTAQLPAADPALREPDSGRGRSIRRYTKQCRQLPWLQRVELLGPLVHLFRPDTRCLTRNRDFRPDQSERQVTVGASLFYRMAAPAHRSPAPRAGNRLDTALPTAA